MITFQKGMYPELTKDDFDKHVAPLLERMGDYSLDFPEALTYSEAALAHEEYPFHLLFKGITDGLWQKLWDNSQNVLLVSPDNFRAASCAALARLAAQNLFRSLAEDVKRYPGSNDDPRSKYTDYEHFTLADNFAEFSSRYPVIWSRTLTLLRNRIAAIREIVTSVAKHREELNRTFGIETDLKIREISPAGDTHNNGRAVAVIEFEDGTKVVFKPRSVSGEAGFTKLVHDLRPILRRKIPSLKALDLGDRGFTSYVHETNREPDLQEIGRLACLMYLLDAVDMHYTNIMWTDEGAVCIDLESLFHPSRIRLGKRESSDSAYNALHRSAYGTGVLPMIITSQKNEGSIDVGFSGAGESHGNPFRDFKVVNPFSADVRIVWDSGPQPSTLVKAESSEDELRCACEQVEAGFSDTYRRILAHRQEFVALVLRAFHGAKMRYIHNPTVKYVQLLRTLAGPEAASQADIAKGLLSRIAITSVSSDPKLVAGECEQLWRGDIPYFTTYFEHDGVHQDGDQIATLVQSPKQAFLSKMELLGEENLAEQVRLIRLAFVAKLADPHAGKRFSLERDHHRQTQPSLRSSTRPRTEVATALRELTMSLVLRIKDDRYQHLPRTWIGPVARFGSGQWSPGVLGYDLYGGRVGPAMALAVSGELLEDRRAKDCAKSVFDRAAGILADATYELRSVLASGTGAFSGVSGLLWAMQASGLAMNNAAWIEQAVQGWKLLPEKMLALQPASFDMISGDSAGLVMRLRSTGALPADSSRVNEWVAAARHRVEQEQTALSSGLAHGLSQLIWFFSVIDGTHGTEESRVFVTDQIERLQAEYANQIRGGLTQLYIDTPDKSSDSWCNGLAGVLIAVAQANEAGLASRGFVSDLIKQLARVEVSAPPVLCHGALGSVMALRELEPKFPEAATLRQALEEEWCYPSRILDYFKKEQGRYALSPGLMSGRAGAVLDLCARLEPILTPSPVTLRFGGHP